MNKRKIRTVGWRISGVAVLVTLFSLFTQGSLFSQHRHMENSTPGNSEGNVMHIHVHDETSGQPLTGAHLWLEGSFSGAVSDRDGHARLRVPEGDQKLVISFLGYRTVRMTVNRASVSGMMHVTMQPERMPAGSELRVTSDRAPAAHSGLYSDVKTRPVDDHMRGIAGVDMVSRTNFARDPVIRGMRDSRVEVVIDGMRMTPACVDGMDPLTAYLESDNLEAIQISRSPGEGSGSAGASGGGVNFQMARPSQGSGLTGALESGYHSASRQQMHQGVIGYGDERWGVRFSGTYRKAGDMRAGGGDPIEDSSLEKGNLYASGFWQPEEDHTLTGRYMGDLAGFIGYPSLLMDTRRADAHLVGLEHVWTRPFGRVASLTSQFYMSQVVHKMDDYGRDPSDRTVMRDMYMPMDGETRTAGIRSAMVVTGASHLLELELESWVKESWGDMQMIPTDPSFSEMSLLTLGEVTNHHTRLSSGYTRYSGNGWRSGGSLQIELATNRLGDEGSRAVYRAELPDLETLDPFTFTWVAALHAERDLSSLWTLGSRASYGTRQPDHMERYGYYIYQPLDGYFYLGNPGLRPETSAQGELYVIWGESRSRLSGRTAVWINYLDHYSAGERIDSMFKRMNNMGQAILVGVETELNLRLGNHWSASGQLAWTRGQHLHLEEPLPMIPPLKGVVQLHWMNGPVAAEGRLRWASAQNRVASDNHLESPTSGYTLTDLYVRWQLANSLRLQAGVENLLDGYHVDHLSVNGFPEPGRNLHLSLRWALTGR